MIWRIQSQRVFAQLRASKLRARSGPLRMTFVPVATARPQVAMAIGRRFGTAVERNRGRRRIRAAFTQSWSPDRMPTGAFLITGSRSILSVPFDSLVASTTRCLDQVSAAVAPDGGSA